jgi:hypothetical protein
MSLGKTLLHLLSWKFARVLAILMGLWHAWQLGVLLAIRRNRPWLEDVPKAQIEVVEEEIVEEVVPETNLAVVTTGTDAALLNLLNQNRDQFMSLVNPSLPQKGPNSTLQWNAATDQDEWESLADPIGDSALAANRVDVSVQRKRDQDYLFRIIATFPTPLNPTVDLACDAKLRPTYDDMVEELKVLYTCQEPVEGDSTHVDTTRVEYVKTKPVFPASGRDMVILTSIRPFSLPDSTTIDGYLNLETSVPPGLPGLEKLRIPSVPKTHVRAAVSVSGRVWFPYVYKVNGEERMGTRVIQIADLNPGGNVPGFVIKFIAGKGIPRSLGIMAKQVKKTSWDSPDQGGQDDVGSSRLLQLGYNGKRGQAPSGSENGLDRGLENGDTSAEVMEDSMTDSQVVSTGKHLSLRDLIHTTSAFLPVPNPVKNIGKNVAHRVLDQVVGKGGDVKMDWAQGLIVERDDDQE